MTGFGERSGASCLGVRWSLIVPVKHLGLAKSRLARAAGTMREGLALAIACDTVSAALSCPTVDTLFVVTDDPLADAELSSLGAVVVSGEPGGGMNPALEHGEAAARARDPRTGVCAMSADLPALRPDELGLVLAAASEHGRSFLADSPGVGTTLLAATPGHRLAPSFEGGSRSRHREGGARELSPVGVESVRRDVDTPEDLTEAATLGLGPRTRPLWARMAPHEAEEAH